MKIPFAKAEKAPFYWLNKPDYSIRGDELAIITSPETDYWQRTHYGFSKDNGHALLKPIPQDFTLTVQTRFRYSTQYDQCGVMIRVDALNWIKMSVEKEEGETNRLGSVVTNLGYSDWATLDIESNVDEMWYRVSCQGNDFFLEWSADGDSWSHMRMAHLHNRQRPLHIGLYACSPQKGSFEARFSHWDIDEKEGES